MPVHGKIIGRIKPGAGLETLLYTVPLDTEAQISIHVSEQAGNPALIKIALTPSGQPVTATDYIMFNVPMPGYGYYEIAGISLAAGDMVSTTSNTGGCSFVATGLEIT